MKRVRLFVRSPKKFICLLLISVIIRKVSGDSSKNNSFKPTKSIEARAPGLFSKGKTPVGVAIKLDISSEEAETFFVRYWRLKQQYEFDLQV